MAKKPHMKGYQKLPFDLGAAIGAVTNGEVNGVNIGDTVNDRMWLSSVRCAYGIRDFTVGEGPIVFGVAHSDYSNTEIEEAVEAVTSWDLGDLIAREQANRKVRTIGTFALTDQGEEVLNDGKPVTTKLGWILEAGDTLQYWVLAVGGTLTTGGILEATGHANAWRR